MRKIMVAAFIIFLLSALCAREKENYNDFSDYEFNYKPYTLFEVSMETLALIGSGGIVAGGTLLLAFSSGNVLDSGPLIIYFPMALAPVFESLGVYAVGNLGFESEGNIAAAFAGGYALALPFFIFSLTALQTNLTGPALGVSIGMIAPGVMLGYAASRETRLYSSGALMVNTLGVILGGIAGFSAQLGMDCDNIEGNSIVYSIPSIFITVAGVAATFAVSRYAIVDEPDNAGTWLGVLGGTLIGALTGFAAASIWKYKEGSTYEKGTGTAFVIGGALFGELIGFALSHTIMPDRKNDKKTDKKIFFTLLPPMMVPETIPVVNKTIKRWMMLNASFEF